MDECFSCTEEDEPTPAGGGGQQQICQRYVTGMATGKWWVTSDVYLPEEVGRGLCACVYVLALHMIAFLPQQPHI